MLQTQSASDPSSKISMINYLSAVDAENEEWQDMGTGLPDLNNSVNMEDNLQMTFITNTHIINRVSCCIGILGYIRLPV